MYPKQHIILGAAFAFILFLTLNSITPLGALIIFFASFLIDADHYLLYIIETKDFSMRCSIARAYNFCQQIGMKYESLPKEKVKNVYVPVCWFHGIEFIILLIILSFLSKLFLFVLIGVLFHFFVDYSFSAYRIFNCPDKNVHFHHFCPTYQFIKSRHLKPL